MRHAVRTLASLRLTVILFVLAMALIFLGTLAQTRIGVWQAVDQYFRSPVAWVDAGLLVPGASAVHIPIPGGLTLCVLMIANLLAAHAARARAWRKRPGVLLLHAGLILLLAGELATGFLADEGLMSIDEGASSSYIEDVRAVELAVIDPDNAESDRVVTAPGWMIARAARTGEVIADPRFPFEIRVDRWIPNALLVRAPDGSPATAGVGRSAAARETPRNTGVDGAQSDEPAAYVTLARDGRELGTWLISAALIDPQRVEADGSSFGLSLRFARTYLPYSIELIDFSHDRFTGTSIAKNFSSDVRIVDPRSTTDRETRIWMNNPLRYAGRTFYQASYKPDGSGTVLQVVRNPAWSLPYIACGLVSLGMTYHFVTALTAFLSRQRDRASRVALPDAGRRARWVWAVAAIGALIPLAPAARPAPDTALDVRAFGQIPVSSGGRLKPLDTAARSMLLAAGGRQYAQSEERSLSATEYLLDLIARPERVRDLPVVRVDHPDLLAILDLAPENSGRVSLATIEPHWAKVIEQAREAARLPENERDAFHRAALSLHDRVNVVLSHAQMRSPYMIPPTDPAGEWTPFHDTFLDTRADAQPHPSVAFTVAMMNAASEGDAEAFNAAARDYLALLERSMPSVVRKTELETLFNRAQLFKGAFAVYLLAFLGLCASFVMRASSRGVRWGERLRLGSTGLLVGAVLVHTGALALRI